jgi:hypothetical protein
MGHVPTLIINGEHDFMADSVCAPFLRGIDRVKWVICEFEPYATVGGARAVY